MSPRFCALHLTPLLLGSLSLLPARAALTLVNVYNSANYRQTSTSAPTIPYGYFFSMGGSFQNPADYNSASAAYPGPATLPLPISGTSFGYESGFFSTISGLHAAYPFGAYNITASNSATSATKTGTINYIFDRFTAGIPAITPASYTSLQNYNASTPLTINFNAYTPGAGTTIGYTFFTIFDSSIHDVYDGGFLPNTATSVLIPGGNLLPGKSYLLELDFSSRLSDTDAVHNVPILQGFDVRTDINFTTAAPEPATLALLSIFPALLLRRRPWHRRPTNVPAPI